MVLRARELLGCVFHRSKVVQSIIREYGVGRPTAYKALDAAIAQFRDEIKGGDLLVMTVAGYIEVAGNAKSKARDKVAALTGLVKVLALDKLAKALSDADEITKLLEQVGLRQLARAGEAIAEKPS